MIETENKKYFLMIHSDVFEDRRLDYAQKLFYATLTGLAMKGYCYASNDYLANKYNVNIRTIQRWLEILSDAGYIKVVIENRHKRKIYIIAQDFHDDYISKINTIANENSINCKNENSNETSLDQAKTTIETDNSDFNVVHNSITNSKIESLSLKNEKIEKEKTANNKQDISLLIRRTFFDNELFAEEQAQKIIDHFKLKNRKILQSQLMVLWLNSHWDIKSKYRQFIKNNNTNNKQYGSKTTEYGNSKNNYNKQNSAIENAKSIFTADSIAMPEKFRNSFNNLAKKIGAI